MSFLICNTTKNVPNKNTNPIRIKEQILINENNECVNDPSRNFIVCKSNDEG